jgi:putative resolvase
MRRAPVAARVSVAYCRVSCAAQKPDLKNQRRVLEDFCAARGVTNVEYVEEVGGGLNLKRTKFLRSWTGSRRGRCPHLIVAHKDRLVGFGFPWFERFCAENGTELLVLNREQLSPEQVRVQDLLTVVHCFSARLYGLRNYCKKLNEALAADIRRSSATP